MEDTIKQKQHFLRKKIIEEGYDPLPFTEYLSSQRENGHDIETWTLKDLTDVVNKYIEISPKPQRPTIVPDHSASEVDESNDEEEKTTAKPSKEPEQKKAVEIEPEVEKVPKSDTNDKKVPESLSVAAPLSMEHWLRNWEACRAHFIAGGAHTQRPETADHENDPNSVGRREIRDERFHLDSAAHQKG